MSSRFFIDRPVFSWVLALSILLAGLLAVRALPIEQYPAIAPPTLTIRAVYPGADAAVLETNVTQVIEQELNGVEGVLYLASTSRSNGSAEITLTFESGTDIDVAQMEVQNRLRTIEQRLPEDVRRQGIAINQASSSFLLIVALVSRGGATSPLDLGNFANTRVVDELRRVPGVGDIQSFSSEYAMRVWLDPERLAALQMSASEVLAAVRAQNAQLPGGQLGDRPLVPGFELNAPIVAQNRFTTAEQFASIILRAEPDGSVVRLGDVARIELGAQSYLFNLEINGQPAAGMAVQLATGANALATAAAVRERLAQLQRGFPRDIDWTIPYDSTPFIRISITEVVKTLAEAVVLVFLVMYLFLQSWRATLIPTIVVPIALAGACVGLWLLGASINVLTLFGMVIAIGILVDDAIVVVENVERIMREEGRSPYEATVEAMGQITSAIVGITLVLVAVFVPMAFFPGSTGGIYRQFALTLTVSIAFSALLALTLTPALCATLLRPAERAGARPRGRFGTRIRARLAPLGQWPRRFFSAFNRRFQQLTDRYEVRVGGMLNRPLRHLAVFALLGVLSAWLFLRLPSSFLPAEDQGTVFTVVQAPPGSTLERTNEAIAQVAAFYRAQPQVSDITFVRGFSFFGQGQANAMAFVALKPWDRRSGEGDDALSIVARANATLSQLPQALVFTLNPPSIPSLGVGSGFTLALQDRAGLGRDALLGARDQLLAAAASSAVLSAVRPEGQADSPQLRVDVDRVRARALGLSIDDINATLAISFASAYANDFSRDGRILRVLLQADAPFRMTPQDLLDLRVRNAEGAMVPFGAFTTIEWTAGPPQLDRYNGLPSMTVSGSPAAGRATGEALREIERLAAQLPPGFGIEWTGVSFEERQAAGQVGPLLAFSVLVVFLLLAALYESWATPIAVLLVVPLGVLGAVLFTSARGLPADVYFNIGLVAIIGLAAKNAILIVEFALAEEARGQDPKSATRIAVRRRLRPVLMTSLTFILAMLPLVIASGAGAASRIAVGTGIMGGMVAATALGVFFIPVLYFAVRRWLARRPERAAVARVGAAPSA